MHIITNNLEKDMTYFFYINNPMPMVERKINMNIAKNPHLINALDRSIDHPMIRKFSYVT